MPIANIPKTYADDLAGAGGDVINPFSAPGTPAGMIPFILAQLIQRSPAAMRMIKQLMKRGMKAPDDIPAIYRGFQDVPEGMRDAPGFGLWDLTQDVGPLTKAENRGMYVYPDPHGPSPEMVKGSTVSQDAIETRFGQSLTPQIDEMFQRKGSLPPDVLNAITRLSDRLREADPRIMAELDRAAKVQNMPTPGEVRDYALWQEIAERVRQRGEPFLESDPRLYGGYTQIPEGFEYIDSLPESYTGLMPQVNVDPARGGRRPPIIGFR